MAKGRTFAGILLIVIGVAVLALLFLWLMGFRLPDTGLDSWFPKDEATETNLMERPVIVAPVPTRSSELEEFYAKHPRVEKRKKKAEERLDTSLWKNDYYTSPEGVSWQKDSNSDKVRSETKTGEHEYTATAPQPLPDGNPRPQQSLRVEFWESPVNYKGYKLDKKQLIIFGISPDDPLRFENHTDGIWMHHNGKVYLLKPDAGYMPFVERGAQASAQDSIQAVQAGLAAEKNVKGL
ncbi:MAG: hypothetical protein NC324_03830 [Bacteroides sp.]|nr:hypothetical protein [Bacteroides sp.]